MILLKAKNIMRSQKQNIKILSMKTLTKKNNSFSNINYSNNTNNIKINPIYNKGKIKSKNNSEFENLKKQITILKKGLMSYFLPLPILRRGILLITNINSQLNPMIITELTGNQR